MNIGLIGLGYWGKNLYRNLLLSEEVQEIFVLDIKNQNFKNKNIQNKKLYFLKPNEFFKNSDIDAFIISTPTSTHYEYIKKCLELDKFVCITKPITSNLRELLALKRNFKIVN